MIYTLDFTIPKSTSENNPAHGVLLVTRGLVYRVEFQFPAGCAGLAHLLVTDGSFQVWPSTLGNWFATDDFTIAFDDMYLKDSAPFQFDFWGYNEDDTYGHTIFCRVGMADKEIFQARYLPNVAYDIVQRELAKAAVTEEEKKAALLASPFPWLKTAEEALAEKTAALARAAKEL